MGVAANIAEGIKNATVGAGKFVVKGVKSAAAMNKANDIVKAYDQAINHKAHGLVYKTVDLCDDAVNIMTLGLSGRFQNLFASKDTKLDMKVLKGKDLWNMKIEEQAKLLTSSAQIVGSSNIGGPQFGA